ncbi:MAG TPA: hypothetical protein VG900_09870 [Hyphomicrobiaceae bacterium]|jgi:ABC-type uncharacterized transport system permease subunit|nr:hypothetical protein [Hyphomicrobiaceae bacterium]
MRLLRLWLLATAALVTGAALWAFAPVVIFVLLLTAALGLLSAVMVGLARALQAWRDRNGAR